jgi:hypothetical protein
MSESHLSVALRDYLRAWLARDKPLSAPRDAEMERLWSVAQYEFAVAPRWLQLYWRYRLWRAFLPVNRMLRREQRRAAARAAVTG